MRINKHSRTEFHKNVGYQDEFGGIELWYGGVCQQLTELDSQF